MFNSREWGWNDLSLILGGVDIVGIRGVKYEETQEKEVLRAKGGHGHSIQFGNIDVTGEIGMTWSAFRALRKAGGGSHLSLILDAVFAYGNPRENVTIETDRITNLTFTGGAKELKQGDKFGEVTVPFIALKLLTDV